MDTYSQMVHFRRVNLKGPLKICSIWAICVVRDTNQFMRIYIDNYM